MSWLYLNENFTEDKIQDYYGFVYLITNLKTNKKYIGKKFFYSLKTKTIKGKKKRIKTFSDWESYYGSNDELKNDVKLLGSEWFRRQIIHLCYTKGECNYLEAKEQFINNVLESDQYYNSWIMVKVHKKHISKYNATKISRNLKK